MKRGEIWWANFDPPAGRRPVVLLSRDEAYGIRTSITIAPITRTIRGIPVEVPLDVKDGLPKSCVINLDSISTIPKRLLESRIAVLPADKLRLVRDAVRFALDL
jgi:mRNA interferase MazF